MKMLDPRLLTVGVLFFSTLLSGYWLSHSGKPYSTLIFTLHKLIALAAVILIAVAVRRLLGAVDPKTLLEMGAAALSALLFIGLVISGALLSLGNPAPAAVLVVHHIAPYLVGITTALTIYLLAFAHS